MVAVLSGWWTILVIGAMIVFHLNKVGLGFWSPFQTALGESGISSVVHRVYGVQLHLVSVYVLSVVPVYPLVESSEKKLLLSLLDGRLLSVDVNTGVILWGLSEDPAMSMPEMDTGRLNIFPNPKDGSLYFYNEMKESLERLPLTIPELVHISPTRSTDGLLYTGTKSDVWLEIDPYSGKKLHTISSDGKYSSCPASESYSGSVFIARTAYTLSVYDSATKEKRWDATYQEYSSHSFMSTSPVDHLYLSSTMDGTLVSIDPATGGEVWRVSYNSPVLAVFSLEDWQLRKVPVYSVELESIDLLKGSSAMALHANTDIKPEVNVRKALYVGVQNHLVYAMDCFVNEKLLNLNFDSGVTPLLEGQTLAADSELGSAIDRHYLLPQAADIQYYPAPSFTKQNFQDFLMMLTKDNNEQCDDTDYIPAESYGNMTYMLTEISIIIVISALSVTAWIVIKGQVRVRAKSSFTDTKNKVSIGKISYDQHQMLGHGSHGTVVFKGTFDERPVAVKRILPECYEMADHEVSLLRHSDGHPNVVRYYCMEEDGVFKYIVLELCEINLNEYVENADVESYELSSLSLLNQAVRGLTHLHHLGIVHRDVKPRNVLISYSSHDGPRAMISDFGLCRKLPSNRHSYTVMSGIAGTEGWIAPEVFNQDHKVTFAADIFSMGCVMFFVLTRGYHPFGPSFKRQSNIASGDYSLGKLVKAGMYVAEDLIKKMISNNCNFRPSCDEVLSHCLFWSAGKKLSFLLDVSDRLEREVDMSPVVQCMESRAKTVVGVDWRNAITEDLRADLKRFRSYHGNSVRDLLRAIRNKKHHYSELPLVLKRSLGHVPDDFVFYFTSRFPYLLSHVHNEMEMLKNEPIFHQYYY